MPGIQRLQIGLLATLTLSSIVANDPRATEVAAIETGTPAVLEAQVVAAGESFTCAVYERRARCWGSNRFGTMGDGTTTDRHFPTDVTGLTGDVIAISAGFDHACAIIEGGVLKCWGANGFGALGDGTTENRTTPVAVVGMDGAATHVTAASGSNTCAVKNGALFCWGYNGDGRLGDGTTTNRSTPVAVFGLDAGVTKSASEWGHTCAIVSGGVKCWGANYSGQLGDGTTVQRVIPVDVVGLSSGVIDVAAGTIHTCALTSMGGVKCWGGNEVGQLGNGTTVDSSTPVDVLGLESGVIAISASEDRTCAVIATGIKCWGRDWWGADIIHDPGIQAVSVGHNNHLCAINSAAEIVCWGSNWYGQLGDGSYRTLRTTPTLVWPWQRRGLVVGLTPYPNAGGWMAARVGTAEGLEHDRWLQVPWPAYVKAGGGTRPAFGDVDGDGFDELVVGFTTTSISGGWLAVFDDVEHDYALLKWLRVEWPAYNAANGETFPAVGDLDGDGMAEIVVGLGQGGDGWIEIFADAEEDFAHLAWRRVNWTRYQQGGGPTHPAVVDIDGRVDLNGSRKSEIILGLGEGGYGWVEILSAADRGDPAISYAHLAWFQVPWPAYNEANGTTYPSGGDLDGDGRGEVVLGLGPDGGGWFEVIEQGWTWDQFTHVAWGRLPWVDYGDAAGELHPSVGHLDSDTRAEIVFGLAPYTGNGGWFAAVDDATNGYAFLGWRNLDWPDFRAAGGGTFPAIARRR